MKKAKRVKFKLQVFKDEFGNISPVRGQLNFPYRVQKEGEPLDIIDIDELEMI